MRAVQSKDARFDGWFFTAVVTTGIYCRPSCPVVPPKPENMRFYPSAAAAQQAGFRACKRCRPDATPGVTAVERARRPGRPGHAADRRRGHRPRRRARTGRPARLQRPPGRAPAARRARRRAAGAGQGAARADRAAADRDQRAADGRCRVRGRVRQHQDLQRHRARGVRAVPDRAAPPGRPRAAGRRARRAVAPAAVPAAAAARTTCSVTWRRQPCPAWRNGGTAPTGAPCGCRTATASWRCGRDPSTSAASSP